MQTPQSNSSRRLQPKTNRKSNKRKKKKVLALKSTKQKEKKKEKKNVSLFSVWPLNCFAAVYWRCLENEFAALLMV